MVRAQQEDEPGEVDAAAKLVDEAARNDHDKRERDVRPDDLQAGMRSARAMDRMMRLYHPTEVMPTKTPTMRPNAPMARR